MTPSSAARHVKTPSVPNLTDIESNSILNDEFLNITRLRKEFTKMKFFCCQGIFFREF